MQFARDGEHLRLGQRRVGENDTGGVARVPGLRERIGDIKRHSDQKRVLRYQFSRFHEFLQDVRPPKK